MPDAAAGCILAAHEPTSSASSLGPHAMEMDELKRLCAERELATCEIHQANGFYGNATVLKR